MLKALSLLLLLLSPFAHAIDNGQEALSGQFPSVIKIGHYKNGEKFHCTGTLLSPTILITAAHCVDEYMNKGQHVSHAKDAQGRLSRLFKRKIKTKNIFYPKEQKEVILKLDMLNSFIKSEVFLRKAPYEQQRMLLEAKELSKQKVNLDLAFIELSSPQEISPVEISKLACDSLDLMTEVTMVGYGRNNGESGSQNLNESYRLQYGHSWFTGGDVYRFTKNDGPVLINSGDSGGPLFRKNELSKVYGVASVKLVTREKVNIQSSFASTTSPEALRFFNTLLADPKAPEELKNILRSCKDSKQI